VVDTSLVVNQQQHKQSEQSASIIELIDDALTVVTISQEKKLLAMIEETRRLLIDALPRPTDRPAIDDARAAAQTLSEHACYHAFEAGIDAGYAADALTARLLVNARVAGSEWERTLALLDRARSILVRHHKQP